MRCYIDNTESNERFILDYEQDVPNFNLQITYDKKSKDDDHNKVESNANNDHDQKVCPVNEPSASNKGILHEL
jgi:hypothetical protein